MQGSTDNENIYHQTYNTSANYNIFPPDKPNHILPPNSRNDPQPQSQSHPYSAPDGTSSHSQIPTQELLNNLHKDFDKFVQQNKIEPVGRTHPFTRSQQMDTPFQTQLSVRNSFIQGPTEVPPGDPMIDSHLQPSFDPHTPPQSNIPEQNGPNLKPDVEVSLERDIYNQRALASMRYPQVFQDAPFFQLPQQNLIINPAPIYLFIDSRDRDRARYPNPNRYRIPLVSSDTESNIHTSGIRYKNICSISLLSAVVPNTNNILDELYVVLQIDEIDPMYDASNPSCSKAFTKLHFQEVCAGSTFLRLDKGVGDPLTKVFYPKPLASLASLTISFRKHDGTLFNFGTDTSPPANPNQSLQNSLTFEIMTKVTDVTQAIGHRNI